MTGRTFDRRLLVLALLPLAIYALVYIVIDRARPTGLEFAIIDPAEFAKVAAAEGQLRYYWLSAFVLLAAVSLAVAASAAMSLYRDAPRRDRGIIFGLVSLAAVAVVGSEVMGVAARWYTYLGEGLFETIFSQITVGADGDLTLLQAFKIGQEVIKGSAAVALLLLTAGLIVTLTRPPTDASFKARAQHIAAAALRQRTYLQGFGDGRGDPARHSLQPRGRRDLPAARPVAAPSLDDADFEHRPGYRTRPGDGGGHRASIRTPIRSIPAGGGDDDAGHGQPAASGEGPVGRGCVE